MKELEKDEIIKYLSNVKERFKGNGLEKLALFGSFAKGSDGVYSDIDVAIKKEPNFLSKYSPYEYFELVNSIKEDIKKQLNRNVDIFDLDSKSTFLKDIKKELIYV